MYIPLHIELLVQAVFLNCSSLQLTNLVDFIEACDCIIYLLLHLLFSFYYSVNSRISREIDIFYSNASKPHRFR